MEEVKRSIYRKGKEEKCINVIWDGLLKMLHEDISLSDEDVPSWFNASYMHLEHICTPIWETSIQNTIFILHKNGFNWEIQYCVEIMGDLCVKVHVALYVLHLQNKQSLLNITFQETFSYAQ